MSLLVDLKNFPKDEGLFYEGELPPSVFELDSKDIIQPESPLIYRIQVFKDEEDLILTGYLEARFSLQCGRCGERFFMDQLMNNYGQSIPIENDQSIDLTSYLREDMLLSLPNYPRCETGNVNPRDCPAQGRFESDLDFQQDDESTEAGGSNTWEALDKLNNLKSN